MRLNGKESKYAYDGTRLTIFPTSSLTGKDEITTEVEYKTTPRKGIYFIGPDKSYPHKKTQVWTQSEDEDARYWFPCYDYPNNKCTSELLVTVPSNLTVISNGKLIGTREGKATQTRTYHWTQTTPHSTYLISFAAGEYNEIRDDSEGIQILYYVPRGKEDDGKRYFDRTPKMIKLFSQLLDFKYPYGKYAQVTVDDFIHAGMENTTSSHMIQWALPDEKAAYDHSMLDAFVDRWVDNLVAHELVHQWFGDLVTLRDWSHAWLNEGFASYLELIEMENHRGRDDFLYGVWQFAQYYFQEDTESYRRPVVTNVYTDASEIFDQTSYYKGALVVHYIRFLLGDKAFWNVLHRYLEKYQQDSVETDDLRRTVEEVTGRNLEPFFKQWLYQAGYPEFKVEYSWNRDAKNAKLRIMQVQSTEQNTPIFQTPAEIHITTSKGLQKYKVNVEQRDQTFYFSVADKPVSVTFDPNEWVLKTLDLVKDDEMLLYELTHGENAMVRVRAAQSLAGRSTSRAIAALKHAMLNDPAWPVQGEAGKALGRIHSDEAQDALLEGMTVSDPRARRLVTRGLGEIKSEKAADALIHLLEEDKSYMVQAEAAKSLGKTKTSRAFEHLRRALRKDSWYEVIRAYTFKGFAELKDPRAIPLALEWSEYGKPAKAREAAVIMLGQIGKSRDDVREHLCRLLSDREFRVRYRSAIGLGKLMDVKALPNIEDALAKELDGRVRRELRVSKLKIEEGKTSTEAVLQLT